MQPAVSANERERQQLISKLKQIQPSGRMLIHISSQIEKWEDTQADVEVRAGDTLYIPKRPNFVMVAGQVYNPVAITFSSGKHANWYLKQAEARPVSPIRKRYLLSVRTGPWWAEDRENGGQVTS